MSPFHTLLVLLGTQFLLALTPGPNWVLIIRHSLQSRRLGLITALGLAPAGACLAALSLLAGSALFAWLPGLAPVLQLICGLYLMWIGVRALRTARHPPPLAGQERADICARGAFLMGFISNLTNPKSIAYFASIFTATGAFDLTPASKIALVFLMPFAAFCWNGTLALLISGGRARATLSRFGNAIRWVTGAVMLLFGLMMLAQLS